MSKLPTNELFDRFFASPFGKKYANHRKIIREEQLYAYELKIGKELVDMDVDEFFDSCDNSESPCLETAFVRQKYDDFTLTGNFVPMYFDLTDYKDFFVEIESKVRHKILKKYNKKKD